MSKGKQRKILNERTGFIKRELQKRLKEVQSQERYTKETKESIKAAISRLTANLLYSPNVIISLEDCIEGQRYKNVMPKGYTKLLRSLRERLQEITAQEKSALTVQSTALPVQKEDVALSSTNKESTHELPVQGELAQPKVNVKENASVEQSGVSPSKAPQPPQIQPKLGKNEIAVNKNADFFIALGKKDVHSFIMFGYMKEGKPIFLARFGKVVLRENDESVCKAVGKVIFAHPEVALQDESLHPGGELSYAAYSINYDHYKQFLKIASLANTNHLKCYQQIREDDENIIMSKKELSQQNNDAVTVDERDIVERTHALSLSNTCRHTAIDLIQYAQGIKNLTDNISRYFFRSLPLTATFEYGNPDKHFYVFPLPPSAYHPDKTKSAILEKIFRRMENLLHKDPYGENTIAKFNALKELYQEQAGLPDGDIEQALKSIRDWTTSKYDIIHPLRDQSFLGKLFVSQSSTEAMAIKIEETLVKLTPS